MSTDATPSSAPDFDNMTYAEAKRRCAEEPGFAGRLRELGFDPG